MKVWVTRTEPGATRQASYLEEHGLAVLVKPVLEVVPTGEPAPAAEPGHDVAVFLSEHAVRHALHSGWRPPAAIAVGRSTAVALAEFDVTAVIPREASSEGIAALFAGAVVDYSSPIIVAGVGGREYLEGWFAEHGITFSKWCVYVRRENRTPLPDETAIDCIVVGSGDGLRVVADLWFAAGGDPHVALVVPSERVAELARRAGFRRMSVGSGASPAATLSAIEDFPK